MPEVSNHPGQPLHLKVQTIKQFLSPGSLNRKKKKKDILQASIMK